MKKSKVIVPALGILLLSAAASISGTVAWFTANRTFEMDAGNFSVISTKTNLECEVTAGVGTKVGANKAIQLDSSLNSGNLKLTDASVDHSAKKLVAPDYTGKEVGKVVTLASANNGYNEEYDPDGDSTPNPGYDSAFANGLYRETYNDGTADVMVYSAFTFELDFSIAYASTGSSQALFMDLADCTATAASNTGKGFRMAFIPETIEAQSGHADGAGIAKVWAPNRLLADVHNGEQTAGADTPTEDDDVFEQVPDLQYCNLSTAAAGTKLDTLETQYTTGNVLMTKDNAALQAPTDGSGTTSNVNYMGTFTFAASTTVHLKYLVVVWFEGTDPVIVNNAETVYETISTHLAFGSDLLHA